MYRTSASASAGSSNAAPRERQQQQQQEGRYQHRRHGPEWQPQQQHEVRYQQHGPVWDHHPYAQREASWASPEPAPAPAVAALPPQHGPEWDHRPYAQREVSWASPQPAPAAAAPPPPPPRYRRPTPPQFYDFYGYPVPPPPYYDAWGNQVLPPLYYDDYGNPRLPPQRYDYGFTAPFPPPPSVDESQFYEAAPGHDTSIDALPSSASSEMARAEFLNEDHMKEVVLNWGVSGLGKRKRVAEAGDDHTGAVASKAIVEVFPPEKRYRWYLGGDDKDPFYLRSCVQDILSLVLDKILNLEENEGPVLYVITGASGIGKSWSINAFMAKLIQLKKNVFLHSGSQELAWMIHPGDSGVQVKCVDPKVIDSLGEDWIYVYDSPGKKETTGGGAGAKARKRNGFGRVSLIFSSPKAENYEVALDKGDGLRIILNLPMWKKQEMMVVRGQSDIVSAAYDIWGGNMRALKQFIQEYNHNPAHARHKAELELNAYISLINKEFALKMTQELEKQEVQEKFTGRAVQNSLGHILVPEPMITDPNTERCFEDFVWRFCSPLAERKFWEHAERLENDVLLRRLLISVFQTPSPKGVLFEKVSHILITNGVVEQFQCHPYKKEDPVTPIMFQKCLEVVNFENDDLENQFRHALDQLADQTGAIALEPKDTSFDAVDMVVLQKGDTGCWSLDMLQDTIAKKHSFHPVKVLWYCFLFCRVFKAKFPDTPDADILKFCKYVPVVPQAKTNFSFEKATCTCAWEELDQVQSLLDNFTWPFEFQSKKCDWEAMVKNHGLEIPPTARGETRTLTKTVVARALLLKAATPRVLEECKVIFNVVNTWGEAR